MKIWRFNFKRTRGTARFFRGHNKYGWWVGANLIPRRFGIYMDYGK